jgi:hypothetical protein
MIQSRGVEMASPTRIQDLPTDRELQRALGCASLLEIELAVHAHVDALKALGHSPEATIQAIRVLLSDDPRSAAGSHDCDRAMRRAPVPSGAIVTLAVARYFDVKFTARDLDGVDFRG